jgi:hypothetical protein
VSYQVAISADGIQAFVDTLDMEKFAAVSSATIGVPLSFDTFDVCVNFWGR